MQIFLYFLCESVIVFLLGRIIPRSWINENVFPYKSFSFEKNGSIYNRLGIIKWKTKLPDASLIITKILPDFMPKKRLRSESEVSVLIKETCVAETTHALVSLIGFGCLFLDNRPIVWLLSFLFLILNIPFIIIQRYNRPRLVFMEKIIQRRISKAAQQQDNIKCSPE